MKIYYHGKTKFTLEGKKAKVSINAADKKADVYFHSCLEENKDEKEGTKIFDWPGEYEVKGVTITCLPCENIDQENLVFYFEIDNIKVCHLGSFTGKMTEEMTQEISETDILLIPISDDTLDAKHAHEIIEEIEPRVVVPMNHDDASLQSFIKEMSIQNSEPESKFDVKSRSDLPEDRTEYIFLEEA